MYSYNPTYYSFSKEKTSISSEKDNTSKMIKNYNLLIKQKNSRKKSSELSHFYTNSILSSLNKNNKNYKFTFNSYRNRNTYFLEYNSLLKSENTNPDKSDLMNTNSNIYSPFFHIKNHNSLITISNYKKSSHFKKDNKSISFQKKRILQLTENNFYNPYLDFIKNTKLKYKTYRRTMRAESNSEFNHKCKEIIFSKYIQNYQQKEIKLFNEGIEYKKELFDIEILRLKKMIKLLKSFIKEDEKYNEYILLKIKKEKEYNDKLIEEINISFQESFLLRFKFAKIERKFEKSFNNKFFLLCVKNGTNEFDKFPIEDQDDILYDKDTLNILSDYELFEKKVNGDILNNKNENINENLTIDEIEISIFGKKLIKIPPRIIFSSPENFILKLSQIESKIQLSLIEYNNTEQILNEVRNEYKGKMNLLLQDSEIDKFYKSELEKNYFKLKDVKTRNNYLMDFIKNIPQRNKKNDISNVEQKIIDIYFEIYKIFPFQIKRKFNEKITILTYLNDIERLVNKLVKIQNDHIKENKKNYFEIQKKIQKQKRIDAINFVIDKQKIDLQNKIDKVLSKSIKLNIIPFKKVPDHFFFHKKKKKFIKKQNDENEYTLLYE